MSTDKKIILYVEDEAIVALSGEKTLEKLGYKVIIADSGKQAIEIACSNNTINLILMDINLGKGIDGIEAASRILAQKNIPIVFLTSHTEKKYIDKLKKITPYGFVVKNTGDNILQLSIEMAFELFDAHNKIKENDEFNKLIVETANEGILSIDENADISYVNKKMADMLGYSVNEIIGKQFTHFMLKDDIPDHNNILSERKKGKSGFYERRFIRKDGSVLWMKVSSTPILYSNGSFKGSFGMFTDISEQKKAEENLTESELRYKLVSELASDYFFEFTIAPDKKISLKYISDTFFTLTGFSREDKITTESLIAMFHEEDRSKAVGTLYSLIENNQTSEVECRAFRNEKDFRWINIVAKSIWDDQENRAIAVFGVVKDIDARKKAENALIESEERFKSLIDLAPDAILIGDMNGIIIEPNEYSCKLTGYNRSEMIGKNMTFLFSKEERKRAPFRFDQLNQGLTVYSERLLTCRDGSEIPVEMTTKMMPDRTFQSFIRDIAQRKRAEMDLRESEARSRLYIENAPYGVFIINENGQFLRVNLAASKITGYSTDELLTMKIPDLLLSGFHEPEKKYIHQLYEEGQASGEIACRNKQNIKKYWAVDTVKLSPTRFIGFVMDITERKKAAEESRKLASVVRHSWELVNLITPDGMMIFLNDAGRKMLGISEEDVSKYHISKVIPEHLQNKVKNELMPTLIKKGYWEGDLQYLNIKTGALTDVHALTFKIVDPETGSLELLANISLDITERKLAEKALQESEEKYRLIFDYTPIGLLSFDDKGVILACNDNFVKIIGSSREKLVGLNMLNLPDKNIVSSVKNALIGSTGFYEDVYHSVTADKITPVRAIFTPMNSGDGKIIGGVGIIEDITMRKNAENALRESEDRYRMISSLTTDYFFQVNIGENGGITLDMLSENFPKITGRSQNQVATPDLWDKIIHPDDIGKLKELMYSVISKGNDAVLECRSILESGDQRWVQVVAHPIKSKENGKTTAIIGGVKDITDRKNSENEIIEKNKDLASINEELESTNEELAATNEELSSINEEFESSNEELISTNMELEKTTNELKKSKETAERYLNIAAEIILSLDTNGDITLLNESGHKLLEYEKDELIGKNWFRTCLPKEIQEEVYDVFKKIINEEIGNVIAYENNVLTKNGNIKIVFWHNTLLKDEKGMNIGTLSSGEDITEKQNLLETAQKHHKIESLGVMAGGIAHDFNNLLGGIYGYIDLARSSAKDPETKEYLDSTLNTMNRARGLTQQLLTFSKGGAPVRKIEPLIPFIQETVQFALSGSNVLCNFDIPENLWLCNFDKNQIGQVIDNLVINALQAMPMGGTIEVKAQNISFENKKHPILSDNYYVKITVKDFGIGIPPEILNRIFDPFFTTKVKGHGLGLATSYSIISRHEGIIDVESETGKWSAFHIYLPAVKEETSVKVKKKNSIQKGSGTIIVMDDEESIRDVVESMLKALGYSVIITKDGNEVIDLIKEEYKAKRKISGIILDLTVPGGMGGKAAITEIRKIDKEVPVFVSSGYAEDPIMSSPVEYGFTDSLCKPFMISDLSDLLDKYLNKNA